MPGAVWDESIAAIKWQGRTAFTGIGIVQAFEAAKAT